MKLFFNFSLSANLTQSENFKFDEKKNTPECRPYHGFTLSRVCSQTGK